MSQFNRRRRMFAIVEDVLHVAEPGDIRSHYAWFQAEGWLKDELSFDRIVRGFSIDDEHGERLVAYRGHDMSHGFVKPPLVKHLLALQEKMGLSDRCEVFGGAAPESAGTIIGRQLIGSISKLRARYIDRPKTVSASG